MKKIKITFLFLVLAYFSGAQTIILQENFTTYLGTSATVPAGWSISSNGDYTSAANCGPSGPNSYKFSTNNATVITPTFASADSVRFWIKGVSTDAVSTVTISESADGTNWTQLAAILPIPTTGTTTHFHLKSTTIQLKFVYTKSAGNVAFDDFNVLKSGTPTTSSNTQFYRCAFRDDPSTTMVVCWCDKGTSTGAKVYYGTTNLGTAYSSYPNNHDIDRTITACGQSNRFARLTVLTPNTAYYFVIHDNAGTSSVMWFKTLSNDPTVPITYISGADSRTAMSTELDPTLSRPRRQDGNSLVAKIRPDFVAFQGDYELTPTDNSMWSDWFTDWQLTIGPTGRMTPLIPTFGDHESDTIVYDIFDIPSASAYFALGIGGNLMRLYSINSALACNAGQVSWLTTDLQNYTGNANQPYWKMVEYHYPFVPHAKYAPYTTQSGCWAPLFKQYKMNLSMEGHGHEQKITKPIVLSTASGSDHGFIEDDVNGTTYIGEGGWGAPLRTPYTYYDATHAYKWTECQGEFSAFSIICVTKSEIDIRTVKIDSTAGVSQVADNAPPCTIPTGLALWNTPEGKVYTITNNSDVAIDEYKALPDVAKVYPDPVKDVLNVSFENLKDNVTIEIYDGLGDKVTSVEANEGTKLKQIDCSNYDAGAFFVFIKGKSITEMHKVLHTK